MRLVLCEMKKIWNWKILGVIAVVCALFYVMFMEYDVKYYKTGNHPNAELVYYAEELTQLYGTSVTAEEFADYVAEERTMLISQAEIYIQAMPVFAEAGIYSHGDYETLRAELEREWTQRESDAYWTLLDEECAYLGFKLQTLESLEEHFGLKESLPRNPESVWGDLNEREKARYSEMIQNGEHCSILSYVTYSNTESYAMRFSILLMLAVLILVSPLLVSDRHENVHYLQYTSYVGRKIMHRQLVATLFSAFALTTLLLVAFGGIYSLNGTGLFWDAYIDSDFNIGYYFVFSLTYGQWVAANIALMYALALGISMLAFVLSRFSKSLIALVMKLIPAFAAVAFLCSAVFNNLFSMMYNVLYNSLRIFGTEAFVCGVVFILGFAAALFVSRREKRVDVM